MRARHAYVLCVLSVIMSAGGAGAAPVVLDNMPAYNWYHGCGPTAAGSIVGYWDLVGLPNLFTASGQGVYLTANVQDQISSPAHNTKYDPIPDKNGPDPEYTSIADFFGTSVDPLGYGWSYSDQAPNALSGYFGYRGYTAVAANASFSSGNMWTAFTAQIDKGYPVLLLVDSDGNGGTDHFVPAFGYEDRGANGLWYALYDTWSEGETVRWQQWRGMSSSYSWGVGYMTTLTAPYQFKGIGPAYWHSTFNWSTGTVPSTVNDSAWIDSGSARLNMSVNLCNVYVGWHMSGTITQSIGGNLSAGQLRIGEYAGSSGKYDLVSGSFSVGDLVVGNAGSALMRVSGTNMTMSVSSRFRLGAQGRFEAAGPTTLLMTGTNFQIAATDPAAAAGLEQLRLIVQGGASRQCNIEAAGRDLGATAGGFENNFALAALVLGGSGTGSVRLTNAYDNNPAFGGAEALYTRELDLQPGAMLDLNGMNLYFMLNGTPRRLLPGDVDFNGEVDIGDYVVWFNHYGVAGGGWLLGDITGNGTVDVADYVMWFNNYGSKWQSVAGAAPVPEPLTCGLLIVGGLALLRRRGKMGDTKNGDTLRFPRSL